MAVWKFACKTLQGMDLDLKLVSREGLPLRLTRAVSGAGSISPTQLMGLKGVLEPVQELQLLDAVEHLGDHRVLVPVILRNAGVRTGYSMYQLGVYAEDPDFGEVLYMVMQSEGAEEVPSSAEMPDFKLEWYINVAVANADEVEVVIDETGVLTVEQADARYVFLKEYSEAVAGMDAYMKENREKILSHLDDKDDPHDVTKAQVGLGNVDDTADMDKPVSTAQQAALDELYQQLAAYTNQKIAGLINGAPESLDTLKEVANAIAAHKTIMDALDAAIGKKASAAEFDSHTKDTTKHVAPTERTNWNDANTKKHTHGNKSVLDGITSTLISGWSAKMEKTGDSANNTSTFTSGDAARPTGWADIGVVASGEKHSSLWRKFSLAVKNIRYLYNLLTSGALSTLLGTNLTANRAVVANGNGKLAAAGVTATELGYLAGVKSKVQDQLNELNTGIRGDLTLIKIGRAHV